MNALLGLGAVGVFVGLNGFFVAAEFALVKLRAVQQGGTTNEDPSIAKAVGQIDRYLSVTQLGITLASLGLGWLGEPAISHIIEGAVRGATGHEPSRLVSSITVGVSFAVLTYGHVLFGELVPKLIAIQRSQAIARISLLPLQIIFYTLRPALWVLEASSKLVLSTAGLSLDHHSEAALSEEQILGILATHTADEKGENDKRDLFQKLLRFSDRTARQAMIPRVDVVSLPLKTTARRAVEQLRVHQFSRIPLSAGDELDQVVGYLHWKDLLLKAKSENLETLESLRRDTLFVPETMDLAAVLRSMQKARTPIAIVVDEYGGASGILTMEDLLEEIVGEIRDEHDDEVARIEQKGEYWDVNGGVTLDELVELGIEVDEDERHETVGAAVLSRLRRMPKVGDSVELGGGVAEVVHLARRRVTRIRVHAPANASGHSSTKTNTKAKENE
jgi:CBS domain containing-hemolysin-like protein